jgi:very-short-patch-repair endonuclease
MHFRRQQVIAGYIADFYCHGAALVVELDGSGHQRQRGYDRLRDQAFAQLGIRTLRFTNQELRNDPRAVVSKIRVALT